MGGNPSLSLSSHLFSTFVLILAFVSLLYLLFALMFAVVSL